MNVSPLAVEDKSTDNGEVLATTEVRNGNPHEAALLAALRDFVKHVGDPEPPPAKTISMTQWFVLLVFVLDAALLYSEVERWFDNPVFNVGLKVLPWMLGASAFTSSERVREWLLAQSQRLRLGILAGLILLPLLILRQPLFSVKVQVHSASIGVSSADKDVSVHREGLTYSVRLPQLTQGYTIKVEDSQNDKSKPFQMTLSPGRVMRTTLSQIPLIGRIFGSSTLELSPLYEILTKSRREGAYADVEGPFQQGFFQLDLASRKCSSTAPTNPQFKAMRCSLDEGTDALNLPFGRYDITLFRDACKKRLPPIQVSENNNFVVNFDEICSQ